jgi:CRP-like cAMP-binding protein
MIRVLGQQLSRFARLSEFDLNELRAAAGRPLMLVAGEDVPCERYSPDTTTIVIDGLAARYVAQPNDHRQIIAFFLRGEWCEVFSDRHLSGKERLCALTPLTILNISRARSDELARRSSSLAVAFEAMRNIERATLREWLINLGYRSGLSRVAHLLCELYVRLESSGSVSEQGCELKLAKYELANALGMTPVHLNRVLNELGARQLATFSGHRLTITNFAKLASLGSFDPEYLMGHDFHALHTAPSVARDQAQPAAPTPPARQTSSATQLP